VTGPGGSTGPGRGGTGPGGSNPGGSNPGGSNLSTSGNPTAPVLGSSSSAANSDPITNLLGGGGTSSAPGTINGEQAAVNARSLPASQSKTMNIGLSVLAGALLLGLLIAPPLVARRVKSR
jgi:hypothetical protein